MCNCHSIVECCVMFSGVKLSIRSFNLFMEKERNRWRKFFSSSENAIWSILLKYQQKDVQIQTFTEEN